MEEQNIVKIPILKVEQTGWNFYVGTINSHDLYHIAETDRIRLENLKVPKYLGFQRALVEERVRSIKDYLLTPGSTFPNSIILTLDSEYIHNWEESSDPSFSLIKVRREVGAAKIIDGQHRCAALEAADSTFEVIVTIFIDLDIFKCAKIFSKINSTQKAVNPSISYELFGYSSEPSPQKIAHDIALKLNTTEGSPFFKKLLMLGSRDGWSEGVLSQATFCKQIIRLYSRKEEEDENVLLRGGKLKEYTGYPLRPYFINNDVNTILSLIWKYFYQIAATWPDQWNDLTSTSVLVKTTGFISFMEVLKKWLSIKSVDEMASDGFFRLAFIKIKDKYIETNKRFIRENYPSGHQGVIVLRNSLLSDLNIPIS